MDVLAVVHSDADPPGVFGETVIALGHRLELWRPDVAPTPPRPPEGYGAVMVFGGAMHPDEDGLRPWMRGELAALERALAAGTPLLGVCLGSQLLARAAGGAVMRAPEPEVGWHEVELAPAAADDPLLGSFPARFLAFQWHEYTFAPPASAELLARSRTCPQAYRLGERAWGVQFHPEVTEETVLRWIDEEPEETGGADALRDETRRRIAGWNELGRGLCAAFLQQASSASPRR